MLQSVWTEKSHNILWLSFSTTVSDWYSYHSSFTLKPNLQHISPTDSLNNPIHILLLFIYISAFVIIAGDKVIANIFKSSASFLALVATLELAIVCISVWIFIWYHQLQYIPDEGLKKCYRICCIKNINDRDTSHIFYQVFHTKQAFSWQL